MSTPSVRSSGTRVVATVCGALSLLWSTAASATPDFPDVVKAYVGASTAPDCIVCHNNELGGLGTATTVFGTYMRSRGVVAYDEDSLKNGLAAAAGEKHDSDGDGVDDIDALKMGLNPNGTANGSSEPPIEYGCLGRVAPGRSTTDGSTTAIMFGLMTLASFVIRKRRRHV